MAEAVEADRGPGLPPAAGGARRTARTGAVYGRSGAWRSASVDGQRAGRPRPVDRAAQERSCAVAARRDRARRARPYSTSRDVDRAASAVRSMSGPYRTVTATDVRTAVAGIRASLRALD